MPVVIQNIALIIMYFAAGHAAWALAIPPLYASVFWPSAGVALAFCYMYGYRVLPGVFLGAGMLAIFAPMVEAVDVGTLAGAAGIGLGSAVQAWFGCFLLRKFIGQETRLCELRSIALFSAFSVFSCLISASIAFVTFFLRGFVEIDGFLEFWQPWFIGDVLGVLIVTPLLLLFLNKTAVSSQRKLAVLVPIIILFLGILAFFANIKDKNFLGQQSLFQKNAELIQRELVLEFERYDEEMEAMHSFYMASQEVDRNEFKIFVKHALEENTGILLWFWIRLRYVK